MFRITITLKNSQAIASRLVKREEVDNVVKFFEKFGYIVNVEAV